MLMLIAVLRIDQCHDESGGNDKAKYDVLTDSPGVPLLNFEYATSRFARHMGNQFRHCV